MGKKRVEREAEESETERGGRGRRARERGKAKTLVGLKNARGWAFEVVALIKIMLTR